MVIKHVTLEEPIYFKGHLSVRFSLLFQVSVLNSEITKASLDMTNECHNLQERIEKGVSVMN